LLDQLGELLEPSPCWVDTLTDLARRQRATYLAHPAAASMSAYRTTQGPAEIAAVNVILEAVHAAGFEGAQAALTYRTVGDFALAFAGFEAAFLSLDTKAQQSDRAAWTQASCPSTARSSLRSGRLGRYCPRSRTTTSSKTCSAS
jgi:hypothetical protein